MLHLVAEKLFLVDEKLFLVDEKLFLVDEKLFLLDEKLFLVDEKLHLAHEKRRLVNTMEHPEAQMLHPDPAMRNPGGKEGRSLARAHRIDDETRASWVPRRSPAGLVCSAELSNACPRLTVDSYHAPLLRPRFGFVAAVSGAMSF